MLAREVIILNGVNENVRRSGHSVCLSIVVMSNYCNVHIPLPV